MGPARTHEAERGLGCSPRGPSWFRVLGSLTPDPALIPAGNRSALGIRVGCKVKGKAERPPSYEGERRQVEHVGCAYRRLKITEPDSSEEDVGPKRQFSAILRSALKQAK